MVPIFNYSSILREKPGRRSTLKQGGRADVVEILLAFSNFLNFFDDFFLLSNKI